MGHVKALVVTSTPAASSPSQVPHTQTHLMYHHLNVVESSMEFNRSLMDQKIVKLASQPWQCATKTLLAVHSELTIAADITMISKTHSVQQSNAFPPQSPTHQTSSTTWPTTPSASPTLEHSATPTLTAPLLVNAVLLSLQTLLTDTSTWRHAIQTHMKQKSSNMETLTTVSHAQTVYHAHQQLDAIAQTLHPKATAAQILTFTSSDLITPHSSVWNQWMMVWLSIWMVPGTTSLALLSISR